jgi:hypothetical protein
VPHAAGARGLAPNLQSLCAARPFRSPTGDVVLVVADVAPIWISAPHNELLASLA